MLRQVSSSGLGPVIGPGISFVIALLVFISGCGRPTASVTGSVSFQGKPVGSGVVVFVDSSGRATTPANVRPDGSFEIKTASVGAAKVAYDNLKPPPLPKVKPDSAVANDPEYKLMAEAADNYVATPSKYKDPSTSGIAFELKPGPNECRITLE